MENLNQELEHKLDREVYNLSVDTIVVSSRIRKDLGELDELTISIMRHGLLHPIVINNLDERRLIAGERRLTSHKKAGIETIDCRIFDDLSETELKELELEENSLRKDLTWQEQVMAVEELHNLKQSLEGQAVQGVAGGVGWGLKETAAALGKSVSTIKLDLDLAKSLRDNPGLATEKTKDAARKRNDRIREEALRSALRAKLQTEIKLDNYKLGDNLKFLKELKDESIDFILTDPPFGDVLTPDNVFTNWHKYEDVEHKILDHQALVLKECFRVLKNDRAMILFFGIWNYPIVAKLVSEVGFEFDPNPLIWNKDSGLNTSQFKFGMAYEPAFHCVKGRLPLKKPTSNILSFRRLPPKDKIHPCEKPPELLRKLIEALSEPGDIVLDPYAGSAATLIAAFHTMRQGVGYEKEVEYYGPAVDRLKTIMEGGEEDE